MEGLIDRFFSSKWINSDEKKGGYDGDDNDDIRNLMYYQVVSARKIP